MSDHKKKIVEQFQMSVMRNELKKNLRVRNSRITNNIFNNSINEVDAIKHSAQQTDSLNSSVAERPPLPSYHQPGGVNLFIQNQKYQRQNNQSNFSTTVLGAQTQRNKDQQYQNPYPGFAFALNTYDNDYTYRTDNG